MSSFMESFFNMTSSEMSKCSMFTFKLVLFTIFMSMVVGSIVGVMHPNAKMNEYFSNDAFFSYKDTVHPNYSYFQRADLTATHNNNILFGSAQRIITSDIKKETRLFLDVSCNLFVINGNPFGKDSVVQTKLDQKYNAYLKKDGTSELLGELKKGSDGVYKLKYTTTDASAIAKLANYTEIVVTYETKDQKTELLSGIFTL